MCAEVGQVFCFGKRVFQSTCFWEVQNRVQTVLPVSEKWLQKRNLLRVKKPTESFVVFHAQDREWTCQSDNNSTINFYLSSIIKSSFARQNFYYNWGPDFWVNFD